MKKYCTNCGALALDTDKFCSTCGAALHWEESGGFYANSPEKGITAGSIALAGAEKTDQTNETEKPLQVETYIKKRQLATPVIISFAVSYIVKTFIILLLFLIGLAFAPFLASMAIGLYIISVVLVSMMVFNNFAFSIDETGFQMWSGIITKEQITIPYSRIQNVNINRSILDRILGLARINIETAGNSEDSARISVGGSQSLAEGHLPGINMNDAKKIHDLLLSKSQTTRSL